MNFQFHRISPKPANPSEAQIQTTQKQEMLRQSRGEFNLYCIAALLSLGVSITSIGLLLLEKIPAPTATTAVELSLKIPYALRPRESRKKIDN